ncbi:MAG TPA: sigma-70 family RNA polymerase sigma factor [Candidatus Eisenbacteria bacterium]
MQHDESAQVTGLLTGWCAGDKGVLDRLLPLVYDELRRIAARHLERERPDHTLQPTALVHEAYFRLIDQRKVDWRNRAQFLGLAAEMMRRILVNHARERSALKRGGGFRKVSLTEALDTPGPEVDLAGLDEALRRLADLDSRKARVVELRFFGGLTNAEAAEVLAVSEATIERDWSFARAWLFAALAESPS